MMELRMTTDLETALPAVIDFNFEELKAELTERLHHYNTLVVTEDSIQEGKADRAKLRKLKEAIETRRKEVKKRCEQPYKSFEAQVKELVALIDDPIAAIDKQVKTFEEQERKQKYAEIEAIYAEQVPETIKDIIPLQRILDPTWLNKGTSKKKITEAIETLVKRTNVDMALLDGVLPKYMAAVRTRYVETLDITQAMNYQDELMAAEESFRQQEEARRQREAQRAAWASQVPKAEEKPPVAVQEPARAPDTAPAPQANADERLYTLRLEFRLTRGQADALKQFLNSNHIGYTNITNN